MERIDPKDNSIRSVPDASGVNRRDFLGGLGGVGAARLLGITAAGTSVAALSAADVGTLSPEARQNKAFRIRRDAALFHRDRPLPDVVNNGDENIANYIATFSKTLPHNALGEVDPAAYKAYLKAVASGTAAGFEAIPMGGPGKLANPQSAYAFVLEGPDGQQLVSPPPPAFSTAAMAGEMVEDYWLALTRDVAFADYGTSSLIQQAADDLSKLSDFGGPKVGGRVVPDTIFRGNTEGEIGGPFVSQFLLKPIPYGMTTVEQRYRTAVAGTDFMTTVAEWLAVQRGTPASRTLTFDDTARYIRNGRDMASYVHTDFSYQAVLNAALMLLSFGSDALSDDNPYKTYRTQSAFLTFGGPQIVDWVARVSTPALKCTWCQKWLIHRRIRPEAFAARVHNHITKTAIYPLHDDVLNSTALKTVFNSQGSYLLPMAYPEGSPTHPSYPAGHAALIGAGVTMLKAFFRGDALIPNPVIPSGDGTSLGPYDGSPLSVGGELNKLAANVALGRDTAGVHYRSDGVEGMRLGEAVAIGILHDLVDTFTEDFFGFRLTRFDGRDITICRSCEL